MADITKEILKRLPEGKISEAVFEGANIVLYTKDREFFLDNEGAIRRIVDEFKKRIELRPDPSITTDQEAAEKDIKNIIPAEAGVTSVLFDAQRSRVNIEVEKPGLAIGKQGSILREIRTKTFWVPLITRTPPLKSQLVENIRSVLYKNSEYRRKFLNKVGHRVYDGWIREKKHEWIRISYLGGGRQVGRSCLFLQTQESRVLLDCGINVASDENAFPHLEAPEMNLKELDAVIVSHSHLDHSGFVPWLFKMGYRGPVYCTAPTRDVMSLLHLDYIKIMLGDRKDPIYTAEDVREMVKHTITLDFEEVTDVTPDVRITLYNAGHILGSALVHLHIGNGLHNLVYTGDLKYGKTPLLEPACTDFPRLETLMIEATYGGKDNVLPPVREQDEYLLGIIKDTIARKGKVLMPVLGSGRAQDIIVLIENYVRRGELPKIPVYIDGLVWDITAIHTAYPEFLNSIIRRQIFHKDENPFLSEIFKRVGSQKERMQVVEEEGSCIILATSGMLTGGPSVEYLKHLADNPKNSLIFTCYQGEGSLGQRIRRGERDFSFKLGTTQEITQIKMEIHRIEITDHSDRKQLLAYVHKCSPSPKKVIINHGEASRCLDLANALYKLNGVETLAPRNLEAVRIR